MLEIIQKENIDVIAISSRDIAELTNKEHKHVIRDIETSLGDSCVRYVQFWTHPQNKQQYKEYVLPKNIALGIVSGYSFELRMKIINRLEELENLKNKPLTYEQVMQNALMIADKKVKELEYKIELDKPKVSFASTVESSLNSVLIGQWAKSINLKEKDVRLWLNKNKYIFRDSKSKWTIYANEKVKQYFELVPSTNSNQTGTHLNYTVKIKGEGQIALTDKILKDLMELNNG